MPIEPVSSRTESLLLHLGGGGLAQVGSQTLGRTAALMPALPTSPGPRAALPYPTSLGTVSRLFRKQQAATFFPMRERVRHSGAHIHALTSPCGHIEPPAPTGDTRMGQPHLARANSKRRCNVPRV